MTSAGESVVVGVAAARLALAAARADLDAAVGSLPEVDGDEAMATPRLLALLYRAVAAKDRVNELERPALVDISVGALSLPGGST